MTGETGPVPGGGPVCRIQSNINMGMASVSTIINDRIAKAKQSTVDGIASVKGGLSATKMELEKQINDKVNQGKNFLNPILTQRADLTILIEVLLLIMFLILLWKVMPLISSTVSPGFSKTQYDKAMKLPETAFNVTELAKVQLEAKALQDYRTFFDTAPFSSSNSGMNDLARANAVLPFAMFGIQYLVPPFVISYILWFIIRFWPYVSAAVWGWIVMLYNYFTTLVECKLGCKWYISMVTGWDCCNPNLSDYLSDWKRVYIDQPVYYEQMQYVQKFQWAKRTFYEIPYRKYIAIPLQRTKVNVEFAKKLYVDRAIEVFMRSLMSSNKTFYQRPRDALYKHVLSDDKALAALYARTKQAQAQISGQTYTGVTKSGKVCKCPATKTPLSLVKQGIGKETGNIKSDLDRMITATHEAYRKVSNLKQQLPDPKDCNTYDRVISGRQTAARYSLGLIIAACLGLFVWSQLFGAPEWIKPTTTFVTHGLSVVATGQSYFSWVWIYVIMITVFLTAISFS